MFWGKQNKSGQRYCENFPSLYYLGESSANREENSSLNYGKIDCRTKIFLSEFFFSLTDRRKTNRESSWRHRNIWVLVSLSRGSALWIKHPQLWYRLFLYSSQIKQRYKCFFIYSSSKPRLWVKEKEILLFASARIIPDTVTRRQDISETADKKFMNEMCWPGGEFYYITR